MTRATPGVGRIVSGAVLGGVLLLTLLLALLPGGGANSSRSAFSTAPDGRRAALLVLRELGWEARPWTNAPGALEHGERVLWLADVPEEPPGYSEEPDEGTAPIRGAGARRLRDPAHYLRFVEEGGTLVAALRIEMFRFLTERLGLTELEELGQPEAPEESEDAVSPLLLPWGEELDVTAPRVFAPLALDSPFEPFLAVPGGPAVVVRLAVGRGELVLLSSDEFAANDQLASGDNAVLLVRLFESLGDGGEVYFDEYSLGGWTPESALDLAFGPRARGFTLHLLAALLLGVWGAAWVSSFPRDPEPLALLAPLDRARAWAGWIVSRGRWDVLARLLRAGVLRRLAARTGDDARSLETMPREATTLPREATNGNEGSSASLDPATVERVLRAHRARLGGDAGVRRAAALFTEGRVQSEAELSGLGTALARLESELGVSSE